MDRGAPALQGSWVVLVAPSVGPVERGPALWARRSPQRVDLAERAPARSARGGACSGAGAFGRACLGLLSSAVLEPRKALVERLVVALRSRNVSGDEVSIGPEM